MITMRARAIALAIGIGFLATAAGAATIETGVVGLKLILLDKYSLGKAKAVYVAKGDAGIAKGPAGDPPGLTGTVEIFPLSDPSNRAVFTLPDPWAVNKASVAKYVNKTAAPGTLGAKVGIIKPALIAKLVGRNLGDGDDFSGSQSATDLDLQAITPLDTLRVVYTINNANDGNTYVLCSDFSSLTVKYDPTDLPFKVLSRTSTAPGSCLPAPTTTTTSTTLASTTTSSTTTSTSTTSTTLPCACPAASRVSMINELGTGSCGDWTDASGTVLGSIACGGLYIGGGASALTLPVIAPDLGENVYSVTGCSGTTLMLGATSVADTGSLRNCTEAGCLFGAPLPVPNPVAPLSTCEIQFVKTDGVGTIDCTTGDAYIDLPLQADVRLSGDNLFPGTGCLGGPNMGMACSSHGDCPDSLCQDGTQPCPLCTADSGSGTGYKCRGGTNNGSDCVPGSTEFGPAGPTSHDCPPSQPILGKLDVPFALTTGTAQETIATGQFCGYCRDADGPTAGFGTCTGGPIPGGACRQQGNLPNQGCGTGGTCGNPVPCTSDADCAQPLESCEQRTLGAFAFPTARTITVTGTPAGDLTDYLGHPGTQVSIFCIPPTFNGAIDNSSDLPGPGAVALPGTTTLFSPSGAFLDSTR